VSEKRIAPSEQYTKPIEELLKSVSDEDAGTLPPEAGFR